MKFLHQPVKAIPPKSIETKRLLLRLPRMRDARTIFDLYAQDEEVTKYLVWRPHRSIRETKAFLKRVIRAWVDGREYTWAITLKSSEQLVGMIAIRVKGSRAEFGYVLAKKFWNKGYATEAITAIVDWALKQREIFRVWAVCDVENKASARVLEKAGLTCESILKRWSILPNISDEPRDCLCYAKFR